MIVGAICFSGCHGNNTNKQKQHKTVVLMTFALAHIKRLGSLVWLMVRRFFIFASLTIQVPQWFRVEIAIGAMDYRIISQITDCVGHALKNALHCNG